MPTTLLQPVTEFTGRGANTARCAMSKVQRLAKDMSDMQCLATEDVGETSFAMVWVNTKNAKTKTTMILVEVCGGLYGIYADVALVLNIVLIFGFLSGLGAVLTLPGIAAICRVEVLKGGFGELD